MMKQIETVIAHPQTYEQINALVAFMKALSIKFETKGEKPYNKEFVQNIVNSKQKIADGDFTEVAAANIQDFLEKI